MKDRTSEYWRELCRENKWPDPPPGEVDLIVWRLRTQDLWARVDGQWFWSRDGRGDWMGPSLYGPD